MRRELSLCYLLEVEGIKDVQIEETGLCASHAPGNLDITPGVTCCATRTISR